MGGHISQIIVNSSDRPIDSSSDRSKPYFPRLNNHDRQHLRLQIREVSLGPEALSKIYSVQQPVHRPPITVNIVLSDAISSDFALTSRDASPQQREKDPLSLHNDRVSLLPSRERERTEKEETSFRSFRRTRNACDNSKIPILRWILWRIYAMDYT